MGKVADTVTPQPVLAVFAMPDTTEVPGSAALVVAMVDVRDPGNAGTVLRTADAAGVDAVVACGGTVDLFNPKTVRASAGSVFHVPLSIDADPVAALDGLAPRRRLGAVVRGGEDYAALDWRQPTVLVLGNEASGLADGLPLDGTVSIPMAGAAESLNVGMACAVICFEALRQRRITMPR
jgi:TrmH family RNA methyltransferase